MGYWRLAGDTASEGSRSYNMSLEAFVKQVMAMRAVSSIAPTVDMQKETDETLWTMTFGDGAESSLLAAEVGITLLFTSEPVSRTRDVAGCTMIGMEQPQVGQKDAGKLILPNPCEASGAPV